MKNISIARCLVASIFVLAIGCGGGDEESGPAVPSANGASNETPGAGTNPTPNTPGTPAAPGETPAPSVDAPYVVSVAPANGAKGVKADANVVVKFDRSMDTASVIAAYSSADLGADKVTFEWNGKDDELTIKPIKPLTYAEGDANVAAKAYSIQISTAAKDTAGHSLFKDTASSFTTARRIKANVPMTSVLTGRVLSNNTFSSANLGVGDLMTGQGEREARAVFSFLVTVLPENVDYEKATLYAAISSSDGSPGSLGAMTTEQVFFSTGLEGFAAEPLAGTNTNIVAAFNGGIGYRSADVTAMFKDDLANRAARGDRTQYRIRFVDGQNDNAAADLLTFDKSLSKLEVVYVAE